MKQFRMESGVGGTHKGHESHARVNSEDRGC